MVSSLKGFSPLFLLLLPFGEKVGMRGGVGAGLVFSLTLSLSRGERDVLNESLVM
jgi:hypothetical protein